MPLSMESKMAELRKPGPLVTHLRLLAEDPAPADHAEVPKAVLVLVADSLEGLLAQSMALLESIQSDDTGTMVAGQWVGGGGGLLSRDTIRAADHLRRSVGTVLAGQSAGPVQPQEPLRATTLPAGLVLGPTEPPGSL